MKTPKKNPATSITAKDGKDGVYSTPSVDGDEFGKRKMTLTNKAARRLDKAGDKETEGVVAKSTAETEVFAKAHERIEELKTSKKGVQEF